MFSEAHFGGILFAPVVAYCIIAAIIFVPVRWVLGRIGFLHWLRRVELFELALYICIVSSVILLAN